MAGAETGGTIPSMLVIRWYFLGFDIVVPGYEGEPAPEDGRLIGVTVATERTLKVMGDLLVVWRDGLLAEA